MVSSISRTKLMVVSSLASGMPSKANIANLTADLNEHTELALPYIHKKSKIESNQAAQKVNDPAFWRKILAKQQEDLDSGKIAEKLDPAKFIPVKPAQI